MTPKGQKLLDAVCLQLDPEVALKKIGFRVDKVQRFGAQLRSFCPIHRDEVIRTLTIDVSKRTFRCSYGQCPGHKGGNLVELYAQARKIPLSEAALGWAQELKIPTTGIHPDDLSTPGGTVQEAAPEESSPVDLSSLLEGYAPTETAPTAEPTPTPSNVVALQSSAHPAPITREADQAASEVAESTAKVVALQVAQAISEKTAAEIAEKTAEETASKTATLAAREIAGKTAEESAREIAERTAAEVARSVSNAISEATAREVAQKTAEETAQRVAARV
ncbi:MAG: hypothetical protein HUU16_01190, partial [Candidatus Omnitrophica bacterium]|nr:hypothetical protein [Candidatus Omnitrophota bacterium]